jgi:hypothetical protein
MPYYLAVKTSDSKDEFLLLTTTPCTSPWDEDTPTISFADPRLIRKQVFGSFNLPIYACSSPAQVMYGISIWLESATINEIISSTPNLLGNQKAMSVIIPALKRMLMHSFASTIKPDATFGVDQMYYAYITRRWAINSRSSPGWKKLFVSTIDNPNNTLIHLAKMIVANSSHSESDQYAKICEDTAESATARSLHDNSFEKFLEYCQTQPMKPYTEQFLAWVNANYKTMDERTASRIFNVCVRIISDQKFKVDLPVKQTVVIPEYTPLGKNEMSTVITNLTFLIEIKQDALFIEYICGLLTCERYIFLLQIPHIMQHITKCMAKTPSYTSLIAYAMSFAMFYVTQLEFAAKSNASESAPFVFMHDMVCEFPIFDDPRPYIPLSVKHIDAHIPFHVPGIRYPVETKNIPKRINDALVRPTSRFDFFKDIPWKKSNIILTGSRYASACWIGPRESEIYGGDYKKYITEYFGTSVAELDALLDIVNADGEPLVDVLGRDFLVDPTDKKIPDQENNVIENSNEEKKVPMSPRVDDAISEIVPTEVQMVGIPYQTEEKKEPCVKQTESVSIYVPEVKESYVVVKEARDVFMQMKYAEPLFANHTDIDVGFVGDEDEFDTAAAALVTHLRKFGKAVGLKFQKPRSYTWVIVTSFLNYTIDFFHARNSALGLILNYMTCYPRAWFDGVSHLCTSEYVCARMSGVNKRYIFTMNDPIYTMMKSARREDISILLNFNEEGMLRRWLEVNMPDVKLILGNVDMTNNFFGSWTNEHNNAQLPWITHPIVTPKSRFALTPWTTENAEPLYRPRGYVDLIFGKKINIANPEIFSRYMAEIDEIASENIVRVIIHDFTQRAIASS